MHHWQGIDTWIEPYILLLVLVGSRSCFLMSFVRLLTGTILALTKQLSLFTTVACAMVISN